jgi:hypothetical protein
MGSGDDFPKIACKSVEYINYPIKRRKLRIFQYSPLTINYMMPLLRKGSATFSQ